MYKLSPGQAVPPDYYAEKFRIMLDSIVRQYADLLSPKEKRFIHSFRYAISVDSQRLYARLATRKGLLFRLDSFHYSEIDSLERCLQELSDAGLIQMFSRSAADILLTKFTKAELLRSFPSIPTSQLKAKCISPIVNRYSDHFIRSKLQSNFAWVFRQGNQILTTIQILFFGNALMNYSVFVLEDLGIQLFEKYWIDTESRLFQTREALDMYLLLLTYNEWVYKLKQNWNKSQAEYLLTKLAQPLQHRLLVRAKSQQILAISREAERKGCFTLALSGYQCAGLAPSTERSIRIHFKFKEPDKARILPSNILTKNDYSASEIMFASRFVKRNRNKLSGGNGQEKMDAVFNTDTDKINPELCFSDLTLHDQPQKNIELAVMEKFGKDKYRCWHIENDGILSLFGLAMWSVIFHKLPGVFINANQTGPLDHWTYFGKTSIAQREE